MPENSSDNVGCFVFLSSTYFTVLQRAANDYFKENYYFLRFQRESNFFKGGGSFFSRGGGPNAYFYRNPYNL